jgi:cytochrome b pre-mRNA-processing protein 3
MIFSLFKKNRDADAVHAVYSAIVAQSRQPVFYAEWSVPDTVTGRFDMISLHIALLFRRLRGQTGPEREFAQAVFDLFFADMDRSLREMGVTDMGVPKKIQKMGNIFFGLLAAIDAPMKFQNRDGVRAALSRNIYDADDPEGAGHLADYVMMQDAHLATQSAEDIMAARIDFKPARVAA